MAPLRGQEPPNIVWLTVEDMSPWIACYGDPTVATPNLDRLAAASIRFDHAYATSPVCAAARSSLITGMYATRIGTMHHRTGNPSGAALERDPHAYDDIPEYEGVPPARVRCFPEILRAAGWYCTNRAKTDDQFRAPVTVWDASGRRAHWRNRPEEKPFCAVFNHGGTHESGAFPGPRRSPVVVDPDALAVPPIFPDTPAVRDALARGKRSPYDLGLRVPLLVRLPGGERAGEVEERVVDFGPTVLSLAGIGPDPRLDGIPFLGPHARPGRGLAFANADRFDAVYDRVRSVTDGHWRYVRNLAPELPYLLPNAYRDRLPLMQDLYALRESGPQRPEQWQVAATHRPAEELYDSRADPWEIRNLAGDPAHAADLARRREALDGWIEDTGDLGLVLPEKRMVEERLWHGDAQPGTAPPELRREGGRVVLSCATPGASIGYRGGGQGPWTVYTSPFEGGAGGEIEVVAHRIGYVPARRRFRLP